MLRILAMTNIAFIFLAMTVSSLPAAAQVPGGACATAQQYIINGGPETSGVVHMMVCQGGTWKAIVSANASGEVTKIGNQTCGNGDFFKYDGTKMVCVTACDSMPTTFDFTDAPNVAISTLTASNILSIVGTDSGCNSNVSVSGNGSPQYRVCSDSTCTSEVQTWTASNLSFAMFGRYLQVRTTSASTDGVAQNVTVTVGGMSNVWTVTTGSGVCGATPSPGDICSDGTVYAGISPDGNKRMYVARCDSGMTWNGSACTGTRATLTWNDGNSNWIATGYTSWVNGSVNTAGLIVTDSNSVAGGVQPHNAAQACADYDDGNGNTDWYLPARDEMNVIYENLVDGVPNDNNPDPLIPGFATGSYWSSSDHASISLAYPQVFSSGVVSGVAKSNAYAVRCARK